MLPALHHVLRRLAPSLGVLIVILVLRASASAVQFELSVPPLAGEKFRSAEWRLWLPENLGTRPVRAIIVRQHGCGRRGLDHADDLQWQALAAKHDAALLGSHLQPTAACADWSDPLNGSERALLAALELFSARAELARAPWAFWGHSGGAPWSAAMADRHPARTVAVFARSLAREQPPLAAAAVPMIFQYGEREKTGQFARIHTASLTAFTAGRAVAGLSRTDQPNGISRTGSGFGV